MVLRRIVLVWLLAAGPAVAQSAMQPAVRPFAERLTDRVPVSGRTLVGLLSTPTPQPPDGAGLLPGRMALPASLTAGDASVCVRAATQDGRYWAENGFVVKDGPPRDGRADLDWPTRYPEDLRAFPLREVAALARRGSCAEGGEVIPVMIGEGQALGTLHVLVNTRGSAVTAALRDLDTRRTLTRATCARVPGGARVAFDARCVLGPTAGLPARVQLRLEQTSRDGLQTEVLESLTLRLAE